MVDNKYHPGWRVYAIIKSNKLTIKDAAEMLNVNRITLSKIVNLKSNISADMMLRLEYVFGASVKELNDLQIRYDLLVAEEKLNKSKLKKFKSLKINFIEIEPFENFLHKIFKTN